MVPFAVSWTINGEAFFEGFMTLEEALAFAREKIKEPVEALTVS